jgi:hypothetical protein
VGAWTPLSLKPARRGAGLLTGTAVCAVVAVLAQLPLIGNRIFYYWDDSAAQFLPMWYRLGQVIAQGGWPPLLDPDSWMGGNFAAETVFGVYNPVNVANYLLVAALPDLAVAATLVKTEFLVLLALGVYLLCREYGAARYASAAVAVALPFAGVTLYFEAGSWAAGLIAFAYTPHVWWSVRRAGSGRLNPLWAFLIGALAITCGSPYGALATGVVLAALLVEFGLRRLWRSFRLVALLGVLVGLIAPLVFLPVFGNAPVTWREPTGLNTGSFTLNASDLLAMSAPTHLPGIPVLGSSGTGEPASYFAWFALPLLPWLDWWVLRARWRPLAGALVVALGYLLLSLGPMFHWPIRFVEYCYLGLAVPLAVLLSGRIRTDRVRIRATGTAVILFAGSYLAWAAWPAGWGAHLAGLVLVTALTVAALWTHREARAWFSTTLAAGTAAVLGLQLALFPGNTNLVSYSFPHGVAELRSRFAGRYQGETMQIASIDVAGQTAGLRPDGAWRYFLFGNAYLAAGVNSVISYTGSGFRDFANTFCLDNAGSAGAAAYPALWAPTRFGDAPLADLMRVETVVVQNALVPGVTAPPGWRVAEQDQIATVLRRDDTIPWPYGRFAWSSPGARVLADRSPRPQQESLVVSLTDAGPHQLVFARLAWPGYHAQFGGQDVPVETGPAGLVVVQLPAGSTSGELTLRWTPPGLALGFTSAAAGMLGALVLGAYATGLLRRRPARRNGVP